MAKKPSHPTWFTVRFDQTTEWAKLRLPEEGAVEWLLGATQLLNETPLWNELVSINPSSGSGLAIIHLGRRPASGGD